MQDCKRFKKQCDQMKSGWFGANCFTWAGGRTRQCQECYEQARALEEQCIRQTGEDIRFDVQTDRTIQILQTWGVGAGIMITVILLIYILSKYSR
jgi:hypothetical protein